MFPGPATPPICLELTAISLDPLFDPFMSNTASTLPTRSTTAITEGRLRACASPAAWAIIVWTSATVSDRCAGATKPVGVGVGVGAGAGEGVPPKSLLPPPPPQEVKIRAAAEMAVVNMGLRITNIPT